MESRNAIKETLAGFSAELLAADSGNKRALRDVFSSIELVGRVIDEIDESEEYARVREAIDLAVESLDAVLNDRLGDGGRAVDALSNVMAATADSLERADENTATEWLLQSVEELRGLLSGDKEPDAIPAGEEGETLNRAAPPDGDSAKTAPSSGAGTPAREPSEEIAPPPGKPSEDAPAAFPERAAVGGEDDGLSWMLPHDTDLDILSEFTTESFDRIAQIEASLLELENNPDDADQVGEIFRAFHTIKGTSGFLGLDAIQKLAHLAENLLDRARDGEIRIIGGYADLSLKSCDMLREMISTVENSSPGEPLAKPPSFDDLIRGLSDPDSVEANAQLPEAERTATAPSREDSSGETGDAKRPLGEPAREVQEVTMKKSSASRPEADASIRVSTARLDSLINMAGELVIAHSMVAQDAAVIAENDARLAKNVSHSGKIIRDLQDLAMALRMVPLKGCFQKMARLVRDLGHKANKPVRFVVEGEETEIDRNMVEAINDPLVHMIRNSVDHGIEEADQRRAAGKEPTGTVNLRAYHAAGNVIIELIDDGKGLDKDAIVAKAVQRGIIEPGRELGDREAFDLIFHAGLSTAKTVTDISGRGVGMDVVRKGIEGLNGRVEVDSKRGEGTRLTIYLPLTMAISDAMLLGVGGERFLLPIPFIANTFRPEPKAVSRIHDRSEVVSFLGSLVPMVRLHELFGIPGAKTDPSDGLVVVIEAEGRRCAMFVDAILGQHQVVIKSLGPLFSDVDGVSGGAILGDGRIGLILDASGILKLALSSG